MAQLSLVVVLVLALTLCCGCLFDTGTTNVLNAPVKPGQLCDMTKAADGCPACSSAVGGRCRDQWYSSALRCSSDAQCGGTAGACQLGYCVTTDTDGDGIDDAFEKEAAELNFPKVLLAQTESCGAPHGVVYRVRRHPQNTKRLAITYVVLYANDCGQFNGHVGDAESFAITVDLDAMPGAPAAVGVESFAHAGTTCASTSSCTTAAGTDACGEPGSTNSPPEVVIYASGNKHANYLSASTCDSNCLDTCNVGARLWGPLLNVGEPGHPMVKNLTTQGFVNGADGWAGELLNYDPWGTNEFSGGGSVAKELTDNLAPAGE